MPRTELEINAGSEDETSTIRKIDILITTCLEAGGDPATIADELRQIADTLCGN